MAARMTKMAIFATAVALQPSAAYDVDIISDLTTSAGDEKHALDLKSQQFWQPLLDNAEATKMTSAYKHLSVYEKVETAIAELPTENAHVKGMLTDALTRLKRSDKTVFDQAVEDAEVSNQHLMDGPANEDFFSFLTGGQDYFAKAIRRFVGFGKYAETLGKQVRRRQADVAPMLRGAAGAAHNVLDDTRTASKLAFDVLKYDIYEKGHPKTPEVAKQAANKLIDAISETRHNFLHGVTDASNGIARDSNEKDVAPAAAVTSSLVQSLNVPMPESKPVIIDF